MKKIRISLDGCDDSTHFEMRVSPSEYALVLEMALASQAVSSYGCMPTMNVQELTDESEQE